MVPANARANSMKQPADNIKKRPAASSAYAEQAIQAASKGQKVHIKQKSNNNFSNGDSGLISEQLDKKHVINLSTGNQKNIKVSLNQP